MLKNVRDLQSKFSSYESITQRDQQTKDEIYSMEYELRKLSAKSIDQVQLEMQTLERRLRSLKDEKEASTLAFRNYERDIWNKESALQEHKLNVIEAAGKAREKSELKKVLADSQRELAELKRTIEDADTKTHLNTNILNETSVELNQSVTESSEVDRAQSDAVQKIQTSLHRIDASIVEIKEYVD